MTSVLTSADPVFVWCLPFSSPSQTKIASRTALTGRRCLHSVSFCSCLVFSSPSTTRTVSRSASTGCRTCPRRRRSPPPPPPATTRSSVPWASSPPRRPTTLATCWRALRGPTESGSLDSSTRYVTLHHMFNANNPHRSHKQIPSLNVNNRVNPTAQDTCWRAPRCPTESGSLGSSTRYITLPPTHFFGLRVNGLTLTRANPTGLGLTRVGINPSLLPLLLPITNSILVFLLLVGLFHRVPNRKQSRFVFGPPVTSLICMFPCVCQLPCLGSFLLQGSFTEYLAERKELICMFPCVYSLLYWFLLPVGLLHRVPCRNQRTDLGLSLTLTCFFLLVPFSCRAPSPSTWPSGASPSSSAARVSAAFRWESSQW